MSSRSAREMAQQTLPERLTVDFQEDGVSPACFHMAIIQHQGHQQMFWQRGGRKGGKEIGKEGEREDGRDNGKEK